MPDIGFLKALGVRMVDWPTLIVSLLDEALSQTVLLRIVQGPQSVGATRC
jgi:hypothetical protein